MSDVTVAAEQDAIAESLLGDPQEQSTAEQVGTEQQEQAFEEQPSVEAEAEQVDESETPDDWLPSEQDKVFSDDVLARYAQRYQKDEQWLSDPLNRQLLIDKLNADIFLQQQRDAFESQQALLEEEPEAQPEPTQPVQQVDPRQHFAQLDRLIQERSSPEIAKQFASELMGAICRVSGVGEKEVNQLISSIHPDAAAALSNVASRYMLNLVNTFIPDMIQANLQNQIGQAYPDFQGMYERSSHAMAWDRVRNSDERFANLPAYGTKEFSKQMRAAAEKNPELAEMIAEADGKPVNVNQVTRWYGMLARGLSENVDPQLVQKTAAAMVKNQKAAAVRRSAGNLGSGQSKGAASSSSSKFQTNSDIFDDEAMSIWQREHGRL